MAEILGLGCTHRPVMLRRDEDWTGMMKASLDDPDMPEEMKDPARWPPQLREELGNDVAADRRLYDALESGDYPTWHGYKTDQIEDSGQHEVLNWFCLLGAMEELGRKPDRSTFIESWAFVSPVVFAHYNP